jgi:phosphoglycerate kinase
MECDMSELIYEEKIVTPKAVLVRTDDGVVKEKQVQDVTETDTIFDATKTEVNRIIEGASSAKMILWNGPLGNYEEGFKDGTELLANSLSKQSAHTIVGGGDTIAVISKLNLFDKFGFVSTGGGAMLEFLAHGTLPGIEALKK